MAGIGEEVNLFLQIFPEVALIVRLDWLWVWTHTWLFYSGIEPWLVPGVCAVSGPRSSDMTAMPFRLSRLLICGLCRSLTFRRSWKSWKPELPKPVSKWALLRRWGCCEQNQMTCTPFFWRLKRPQRFVFLIFFLSWIAHLQIVVLILHGCIYFLSSRTTSVVFYVAEWFT